MLRSLLPIALCLSLLAACTTRVPVEADAGERDRIELPIEGGQLSDAFAATGVFVYDGTVICTGTLVDVDKVLSAAHCFDEAEPWQIAQAEFALGEDPDGGQVRRYLASAAVHPDFTTDDTIETASDVSVVTLAEPITEVLPAVVDFDDHEALVGAQMVLVGYGRTASSWEMGTRRHVVVTVDEVTETRLHYPYEGGSACNGDSGGPAFVESGGKWRQVGITSGGPDGCLGGGFYVRTDAFAGWLVDHGVPVAERDRQCDAGDVCDGACFTDADCPAALGEEPVEPPADDDDDTTDDDDTSDDDDTTDDEDPGGPAEQPACYWVYRTVDDGYCNYWDWDTDLLCAQYPLWCDPWNCWCPY